MLELLNYGRYLIIPLGYFIGSISGAYVICRLIGKFDIRSERDGRISAAEVYRKLGTWPFLLVVGIDVVKGLVSVTIAQLITQNMSCSLIIVLITGFLTVTGHNWSVFLRFKGGLGATVMYGVLGGILFFQTLIALIPGMLFVLVTKKSGLSTAVIIISLCLILLIQWILNWQLPPYETPIYLIFYPAILIALMLTKRYQVKIRNAN